MCVTVHVRTVTRVFLWLHFNLFYANGSVHVFN